MQKLEKGLDAVTDYDLNLQMEEKVCLRELKDSLRAVAPKLIRLDSEHETYLKKSKGKFNLFTVLRDARNEVGLHTPWLAHLLNPKETHGCDGLFLDLFLKRISAGVQQHEYSATHFCPTDLDSVDAASATVMLENKFGGEKPDILIKLPHWGAIIIENKIGAVEVERQLARYHELLGKEYPRQKHLLLYLTLDGKASRTAEGHPYYRISYKSDILAWIEECLRETSQHANIYQALQQYKNVVFQVIYHRLPLEESFMKNIKKLVRMHPAIITHYENLGTAIETLRQEAYVNIWKKVNAHLKGDKIEIKRIINDKNEEKKYLQWQASTSDSGSAKGRASLINVFYESDQNFYISAWMSSKVDRLDKEFTRKMQESLPELQCNDSYEFCRATVDLPEVFTNKGIGDFLTSPEKLTLELSKIIRQYFQSAKLICPAMVGQSDDK